MGVPGASAPPGGTGEWFRGAGGQDPTPRVLATLDERKLSENTIVLFTSDNGPVLDDGYADGAVEDLNGHTPAGKLKGGKYSPYEGGTRVPFIVRWPARVKPGASDALVCQVDLLASLAALASRSEQSARRSLHSTRRRGCFRPSEKPVILPA